MSCAQELCERWAGDGRCPCAGETAMQLWTVATSLELVRGMLRTLGLTCIPRHPDDDPVIVETWL